MNTFESTQHHELNEKFSDTITLLTRLQWMFREQIHIDSDWKILGTDKIPCIESTCTQKQQLAQIYLREHRSDFDGSIDIQMTLWTIICTYDSRKSRISGFRFDDRGTKKPIEINGEIITIIWIDINPEHREDNVSPTISLHHEFQHHLNTTLGDTLLTHSFEWGFASLERSSDTKILNSRFRSRSELTGSDERYITSLFWRSVQIQSDHPAKKTPDYERYEQQMYYLDELSAHYGQASSRVFWPKKEFYNNLKKWNHYDLIGNHPDDIKDLQELYQEYLMPWIYLPTLLASIEKSVITENRVWAILAGWTTWEWQNYLQNLRTIQYQMIQILGNSRTIHQAKVLMEHFWKNTVLHPQNGIRSSDINWLKNAGKQLEIYL